MFHKIGDYNLQLKLATDGIGDLVVETPFRTRSGDGAGTVNLDEANSNGISATLMFDMGEVVLKDFSELSSESLQGFLASPKRWKSAV
jgi:hypothetical protein